MRVLPADLGAAGAQPTGLSCPDCQGVLTVRVEGGAGHLHFLCRIGHAYSLRDLLSAMEERIEARLWMAVVACEELEAALRDLQGAQPGGAAAGTPHQVRGETIRGQLRALRGVLEANVPIDLAHIQADGRVSPSAEAA
jgi:two-component system chemotaxis response regulator CheB